MCLCFGCYVAVLAAYPVESLKNWKANALMLFANTPFGKSGGMLLLFAAPLLALALLAIISLEFSSRTSAFNKEKVKGRASLQKLPIVTRGRMGIVTAAEMSWIVLFLLMFCWIMANYLIRDMKAFETMKLKPFETMWGKRLKRIGTHFGFIGVMCLNLLFLPVSRGSVLLRAIDIPFEHAVKYHMWLGHFMMSLFTLHGLSYIIAWAAEDRLIKIFDWAPHKVANFAGVIALSAGITMWITSIGWIRKKYFETFYWFHHLYMVFVLFMALHVGAEVFNVAFCGIFLFVFDRFLRFCQSRSRVGVFSTKLLRCGTIELTLAKPPEVKYHALSYIFLNVPEVSKLQWHPFSVSTSPYDGDSWVKVLIKPSKGGWTHQLQHLVSAVVRNGRSPSSISAAVEGPYGHESDFFLQYETLILVAGGIGISPFLALLRDLLQRCQRGQPNLPLNVHLIWAVRKAEELQLLDLIPASTICPNYKSKLNLQVHAFVTREASPLDPEGDDSHEILTSLNNDEALKHPMSIISGAGSNLWITACFLSSLLGYIIVFLAFSRYTSEGTSQWATGLVNVISMVLGVVIFGGFAALVWNVMGGSLPQTTEDSAANTHLLSTSENDGALYTSSQLLHPSYTHFGHRPNLKELFDGYVKLQRPGSNAGVLVCGPESLQTSVAESCRAFNTVNYNLHRVAFSYHSVSFDL